MSEQYEKMSRPPDSALKRIEAGDLKGKTDINPQWRYEIMDSIFGLCGIGWRYEIVKLWDYPTSDGTILCFAQVSVQIKENGEWSSPVPGVGGNTLVNMVKPYKDGDPKRPKPNDEGYKMAITDALSTALKMIGVAADIYRGNWDGSKYRDDTAKQDQSKHIAQATNNFRDKVEAELIEIGAIMKSVDEQGAPYFTEEEKAVAREKTKGVPYTEEGLAFIQGVKTVWSKKRDEKKVARQRLDESADAGFGGQPEIFP